MRTIGIDLAITAAHKAVVLDDATGQYVTRVLSFHSVWEEIEQLVAAAREEVTADHPLRAVMEPTGLAWFTVAAALQRLGVTCYLVNGRRVHDLRRFYKRHSSSDRISARVLAKMPLVDEDSLYPLEIPSPLQLACQRGCKQFDRIQTLTTAIRNRLRDTDRFAWPGLESVLTDIFSPTARLFRQQWYDPSLVIAAGADQVRRNLQAAMDQETDLDWVEHLVHLAHQVLKLYSQDTLDYSLLQEEVCRDQRLLAHLEQEAQTLERETIWPTYLSLHPSQDLESMQGIGVGAAPVFISFIGRVERFPDCRHFRGWHGLVPESRQSGEMEGKGLHISQAGPDLVKKFGYLCADVARRYDPQIAAIYYDQMVHKGKHHNQAVCACATHLLDRVYTILKEKRPYELRDVDGRPISKQEAREIVVQRYTVPDEVRKRNSRRKRKERAERKAEQKRQRRSRSRR
jgi:transposase